MTQARRSDAVGNDDAIKAGALRLLGTGRNPSMAEIAAEAGVSRQTLYAHYRNRALLYQDLAETLTAIAAAAMDEPLPTDPVDAVRAWAVRAWELLSSHPALLNPALAEAFTTPGTDPVAAHEPVTGGLRRALDQLRSADPSPPPGQLPVDWTIAAVVAVGHAAAGRITTGQMTLPQAGEAFSTSVLRLCRPS